MLRDADSPLPPPPATPNLPHLPVADSRDAGTECAAYNLMRSIKGLTDLVKTTCCLRVWGEGFFLIDLHHAPPAPPNTHSLTQFQDENANSVFCTENLPNEKMCRQDC